MSMLSLSSHQLLFYKSVFFFKNPPFQPPGLVPKFLTHESPNTWITKGWSVQQQIGSKRFISNSKPTWQQTNEIRNFLGRGFMKIPLLKTFRILVSARKVTIQKLPTGLLRVWNVNFGKTLMQKRLNNLKYFPSWCIRERKFFSTTITVITTSQYYFVCQKYW